MLDAVVPWCPAEAVKVEIISAVYLRYEKRPLTSYSPTTGQEETRESTFCTFAIVQVPIEAKVVNNTTEEAVRELIQDAG